jgi:hypothetical protein
MSAHKAITTLSSDRPLSRQLIDTGGAHSLSIPFAALTRGPHHAKGAIHWSTSPSSACIPNSLIVHRQFQHLHQTTDENTPIQVPLIKNQNGHGPKSWHMAKMIPQPSFLDRLPW